MKHDLIINVARVCHEANRAWCLAHKDVSQKEWDNAEPWQRDSAIKGVEFALANPNAPASAQHDAWMADKIRDGWKHGEVKDSAAKTHPCIVPFEQLPDHQQKKDHLFRAIVATLAVHAAKSIAAIVVAAIALAAVTGAFTAAGAADMSAPVKAPPAPSYVNYDPFSGFYLGANVGYGWDLGSTAAAFQAVPLGNLSMAPQGFLGGLQAGYGVRFANSLLYAGIEGDVDAAALSGSATMPGLITMSSKNSWLTSVRTELGVIPVGHALLYGTIGWGWGGGSFSVNDLNSGAQLASVSPTMSGLVWGGGVKFPLSPNWVLDVKYLQYDFSSFNTAVPAANGAPTVFSTKDRVDVVRVGLNYKF